ncbi:hypothetical protein OSB04_024493 [Centaurea solstitialis]|uniref:Integrase catalytic domain-containing protein n=1 Tax=Centaurea solstitialis TaxID=347529 RepID=A0AA38SZK7_9ASTR|nr:hypothetical protein OSB04_024493 [Centaurea solstitialis]
MANTVTNTNNISLRSILEKDKLTGPNVLDWERNLMIVLRHERKWYVLEEPLGEAPPANATAAVRNAHKKHSDDLLDVGCLMLATMSPDLQTGLINTNAYDMIRQLREMFQTQARTERYDATKAFNECKMIKGTSVSDHVMKMKRHLDHLERLAHPVPLQLATDTILNSLSDDYKPFVINYNMNNMEKTIAELHSMLKTTELNMGTKNKTKDVLMVRDGGVKKKHGHGGISKGKGPVQTVQNAPKVRENGKGKGKGKKVKPNKARIENRCFTCNEVDHWRQNYPKRHEAGGVRISDRLNIEPLNLCTGARPADTNVAPRSTEKCRCFSRFSLGHCLRPAVLLLRLLYPGKQTPQEMDHNGNPIVSTVMTSSIVVTTIPIVTTNAPVISSGGFAIVPMNHAEKPEKFAGLHFKRWQQKNVLLPYHSESGTNYVLNGLVDALYNVYSASNTSKELWQSLEKKYKTEDAGSKKFVVARFLEFKMSDSKIVISQVQELQVMLHDIHAEGMTVSETFQVAAMIEKLPPAWVDFKNYLKHKRKEISVEDLIVRLRIEEDNKLAQKKGYGSHSMKANVVEHGQASKTKGGVFKNHGKCARGKDSRNGRGFNLGPNGGVFKKKFQGNCYNYDKPGHRAINCRFPKRAKAKQANFVDDISRDVSILNLTAMISEVNLVGSNPREWWIDTGATRHVCSDKEMFHGFKTAEDGEKLFMGNSATADIKGSGKIVLKMTSGKDLTLTDVLYVPEIRKNLVSGWLLNKHGFRLIFESDKFVLTKMGVFVGKGYAVNGMFKLNVMAIKPSVNEINKSSAYLLESSYTWHGRFGHVNFDTLRRLINLEVIPKFHIDSKYKCQTCVEAKLTRSSFQSIDRSTNHLDMIHTDVCDMKSNPSRGGNKFFITFIDDCTKYCYIYLLKSKDETIEKFVLYKNEVENHHNKRIKVLRSDRGGEYVSPFAEFCGNNGIRQEFTAPYSPQQNGIAERKNRTLKEMMNAMLLSSGLPPFMWGEAVLSANYILNKVPRKTLDKTPYELWMGRKPSYKYLRVWGCLAKVVAPPPKAVKIGPKTVDCIFIGNASFFEDVFPCLNKEDASASRITPSERNEDHIEEKEEEEEIEPRRSKRARVEKTFGLDFYTYMFEREPQTFQEAVTSSEGPQWKEAIKSEMDSILQNHA